MTTLVTVDVLRSQISLQHSAGKAKGNLHIVNRLDLFSHRWLVTDRQAERGPQYTVH